MLTCDILPLLEIQPTFPPSLFSPFFSYFSHGKNQFSGFIDGLTVDSSAKHDNELRCCSEQRQQDLNLSDALLTSSHVMPLLTAGAVPPPPGVTPDFQHPRDAGRLIVLVGNIVCVTLVQFAFLLRCYVKHFSRQRFTIEDWSFTIAWILITLYATVGLMMYKHGMGFHAWDLSIEEYSEFLKWLYIQSLLYGPTVFCTKATLLLLTSRVCSVRETISKGINIFICFLVICYIPLQVIKTVICLPVRAYWDSKLRNSSPDVTCLNQGIVFVADSCIAVITDATIFIIPVVLVWSMGLSLYKKIKVAVLLGAGGVAVAVTASRVPLLFRYEQSMDVSSSFVLIALLCSLEQTIGFICACLPFLNILKSTWRRSSRQNRLLANVPRTSHRGKLAGIHGLARRPSRFGDHMGTQCIMMTNDQLTQVPEVSPEIHMIQVGSWKQAQVTGEETSG